jgi:hypothetical protein
MEMLYGWRIYKIKPKKNWNEREYIYIVLIINFRCIEIRVLREGLVYLGKFTLILRIFIVVRGSKVNKY